MPAPAHRLDALDTRRPAADAAVAGPLWRLEAVALGPADARRLADITADIEPGVTALLGESGSGKTSLLNLLVEFETPTAGRLLSNVPKGERLPVYWGPPHGGLWSHLSVREHLEAVQPEDDAAERDAVLNAFDLMPLADRLPEHLSQGERSRLNVARALASGARVLVLDEPLAHVSPSATPRYWEFLVERLRTTETSLVFATHQPETVLAYADRVWCLQRGRLLAAGDVRPLYDEPPTPEVAAAFGPVNWLGDATDEQHWRGTVPTAPAIRPERLALAPDPDGPLAVVRSRWAGAWTTTDLVTADPRASGRREPPVSNADPTVRWVHRTGEPLAPGARVRLKLFALAWLACLPLLAGCDATGNAADIAVVGENDWLLPADGRKVPAPRAVTLSPEGELYLLDTAGRVLVYSQEGKLLRQWHMPSYDVGKPEGIRVLKDGRVAVADTHYHRVVFFDKAGNVLGMFGSRGDGPGQFVYPVAITQDDAGDLYVCEYGGNDRCQKFKPDGTYLLQFGRFGTGTGEFQRPSGVAWHEGRLYIVDAFNSRVQVFDAAGGRLLETLAAADPADALLYPYDISVSPAGELFVVEYGGNRVSRLDRTGKVTGRFSGERGLMTPWRLCYDPRGRIWIADTGNRRVVEWTLP